MANWHKDYNPEKLAKLIDEAATIAQDGSVSYSGFAIDEYRVLLGGMIELNKQVPDNVKKRILTKACFKSPEGKITKDNLLKSINTLESEYLSQPIIEFRLFTGISLSRDINVPIHRINGANISINRKLSKKMKNQRTQSLESARRSIIGSYPRSYADVLVTVKAKSPHEAAQRALDSLDFMRGMWNFSKNRGKATRLTFSARKKPVNSILLAPIHTLHLQDGSPASETWWYEPSYSEPTELFTRQAEFDEILKFTQSFRKHLSRSNYKSELITITLRYARALDTQDLNDAYLKLWGILETLTGTGLGNTTYKEAIRRAAFIVPHRDYDYSLQVLTYLKDFRNKFVHAGSESDEIESLLFLLKRYVEILLEFHLGNSFRFKSIVDACNFMDMPNDKKILNERIKVLSFAKKFIS
jgi:hypothetical protein